MTHAADAGAAERMFAADSASRRLGITLEQVAFCGDDLPDLAPIKRSGVGITVPNAPDYMHTHADWITDRLGGHGAVREICDTLLTSQGHWDAVLDTYLHGST